MYKYNAEVVKVIDGDTLDLNVDLGFTVFTEIRVRLARIDAYEVRLYKGTTEEEKAKGIEARELLEKMAQEAKDIVVNTTGQGKYGRWIAELWIDGINVNDLLVKKDFAIYVNY